MPKFFKSVNTFLNNKIGKEMGKLDPRVSGLLGSFFPGLGGGIEIIKIIVFYLQSQIVVKI